MPVRGHLRWDSWLDITLDRTESEGYDQDEFGFTQSDGTRGP